MYSLLLLAATVLLCQPISVMLLPLSGNAQLAAESNNHAIHKREIPAGWPAGFEKYFPKWWFNPPYVNPNPGSNPGQPFELPPFEWKEVTNNNPQAGPVEPNPADTPAPAEPMPSVKPPSIPVEGENHPVVTGGEVPPAPTVAEGEVPAAPTVVEADAPIVDQGTAGVPANPLEGITIPTPNLSDLMGTAGGQL
jgi:hypothetical protein